MSNQNQQTTNITTISEAQQSQVACQNSTQFNYCEGIIAHNINIENVQHLILTSKQSEAINSAKQSQTTIERIQNATLELKEKLQECYKDVTLPCVAWLDKGDDLVISHHYTELQLDVTEIQITIEQLFEKMEHDKEPRRILIEGQPGYGKTTLATKLIYDWALSENYIKHFKLAFFIPLRELDNKTIDDTLIQIANYAKFKDTSQVENIIQENISNILLILDGLDELQESDQMSIFKLLNEKQYFQMTVIVTCRTGLFKVKHTSGISRKEKFYDKRAQVLGIAIEKRKEFLLKFIPSEDADHVINQINNLTRFVADMFRSPLFLILLAFIAMYKNNNIDDEENEESALTSKTNLFKRLFNCIINRSLKSEADNQFDLFKLDSTTHEIRKTIQQFGKSSLDQLLRNKMQFNCNKLTQEIYKMGFLIKQQKIFKFQTITHYEAFHLSILEFSAAFSIWMDYKQQICESPQNSFECVHKYHVMLNESSLIPNFLIGLFQDEAGEFYNQLSPYAHLFSSCQYKLFNLLLEYKDNISWERVIPSVTKLIPLDVELRDNDYAQLYSSDLFENLLIRGVTSHKIKQIRITNNTPVRLPKNTTIPHLYLEYYSKSSHNIQESLIGIKCSKLTVSFNPSSTHSDESAILNVLGLFASIPANSYSFMFSGRKYYKDEIYSRVLVNQIKYTDFEIAVFNTAAKNLTVNLLRRNQIKNLHLYLDSSLDQCDVESIFNAVANSSYLQSLYVGLDDSNGRKYIDLYDLTKKGTKKYNVLMVKTGSFLCKRELKNKKCIHSIIINQQSANIYNFSMVNPTVFECYSSNFWEFTQPWTCFKYLKKLVLVSDQLYVLSNNEHFWYQLSGCENLKILELYFPTYQMEKNYANEEEIITYFQRVPIETFIIWNVKATNDITNKILKTITDCLLFNKMNLSLKTITLNFTFSNETDDLEEIKIFSSIITDLLKCLKLHHLKAVNIICDCKHESPWDSLMQLNIIDYSIFKIKHSIPGFNSDDESGYNRIICKQFDLLTYHTFSIRLKQENVNLNRSIWFNAFRFLPFFNKF